MKKDEVLQKETQLGWDCLEQAPMTHLLFTWTQGIALNKESPCYLAFVFSKLKILVFEFLKNFSPRL